MKMMSIIYDCQRLVEEEEEDEDDEADEETEIPRMVLNRQVVKRRRFTLYEKMVAFQQIQRNIEVSELSIWAACRIANIYHKKFITWQRDIVRMQERQKKKAKSM